MNKEQINLILEFLYNLVNEKEIDIKTKLSACNILLGWLKYVAPEGHG